MRLSLCFLFLLLAGMCAEPTGAQNLRENEVIVIRGQKYILHQVRTGETVFSLTQKYKLGASDLEKYNPKIAQGLNIGEILKIPYQTEAKINSEKQPEKQKPDGFIRHKIKSRKETAYFLAKKYGITVEELFVYNPGIKKLKKKTVVKIPYWNKKEQKKDDRKIKHEVCPGETLYSISKKYDISVNEITRLNPKLSKKLRIGDILLISEGKQHPNTATKTETVASSIKYFEHPIVSGETLWGLSQKFKVSEEILKALNPELNNRFSAGTVIKVPVAGTQPEVKPINEEAFEQHLVEKGETLFGLSRKYDVSIPDLKKYNPALETRNLAVGEKILIPKKEEDRTPTASSNDFYKVNVSMKIPQSCQPSQPGIHAKQTYNIALFLPLLLDENYALNTVTDTVIMEETTDDSTAVDPLNMPENNIKVEPHLALRKFYGNTENFVQFYEGVLLALEKLKKEGINVCLHVFDTQHKADTIRAAINAPDFLQNDLIIGPIYPEIQKEVARVATENHIPIVSPLAATSQQINTNASYFQVNPSRAYLSDETAEMLAEEYHDSNFIVLKTQTYKNTPEERMLNTLQERFPNAGLMHDGSFTVYDFQKEGGDSLHTVMSATKENVVYIPSSKEGQLSIAISNLNNLAKEYSITLIGTNRYPNYQSIQIDYYYNLKLKYLTPYRVDYTSPLTINYIERFKTIFGTEPNNFGFQGYDVATYFVKALDGLGANFADCLPYFHINLVQGNYHFEKTAEFGGYMNRGVSVIEYTRDYKIKCNRVKGQPQLVVSEQGQ